MCWYIDVALKKLDERVEAVKEEESATKGEEESAELQAVEQKSSESFAYDQDDGDAGFSLAAEGVSFSAFNKVMIDSCLI